MHKLYFAEMLSCRSGAEEEYTERDQLLQDIISLLQGTSYKIRLARRSTTNSAATPHPPNGAAAARKSAVAARDAAASSYAAPVYGGDVGSPNVSPGTSSKCSLTVMQRLSMHHANMFRQVSFDKPCLQALARRPRQPKSSVPCFRRLWTTRSRRRARRRAVLSFNRLSPRRLQPATASQGLTLSWKYPRVIQCGVSCSQTTVCQEQGVGTVRH